MSGTVVLVHGGLWDAEHFWRTTGIAAGLTSYGLLVSAIAEFAEGDGRGASGVHG